MEQRTPNNQQQMDRQVPNNQEQMRNDNRNNQQRQQTTPSTRPSSPSNRSDDSKIRPSDNSMQNRSNQDSREYAPSREEVKSLKKTSPNINPSPSNERIKIQTDESRQQNRTPIYQPRNEPRQYKQPESPSPQRSQPSRTQPSRSDSKSSGGTRKR